MDIVFLGLKILILIWSLSVIIFGFFALIFLIKSD